LRTWLALFGVLAFGCSADETLGNAPGDAAADGPRDAPSADVTADAPTADTPPADTVIDVHHADASPDVAADAPPLDAAAPDATPPDAPLPDAAVPDAVVPDAAAPDAIAGADLGGDASAPPCTQVMGTPPLGLEVVAGSDLTPFPYPTDIQAPPSDPRLFIVEQDGIIELIDASGTRLPAPFLDISARVLSNAGAGEQGLLGLAFHPDYANNGRFFVDYIDLGGDTQVSEFLVSANPDVADDTSERPILSVAQPFANHNGGQIGFGGNETACGPTPGPGTGVPCLYIALGDGGAGCDPFGNGQNQMVLLGKILRIDVDRLTPPPYEIPATNPYNGSFSQANEIWAYGVRNPWRFSFDRATADLYIGDVGQDQREEIDVQPASSAGGENYGWAIYEANVCQDGSPGTSCNTTPTCDPTGKTFPVLDYPHNGGDCSVTGGYVYQGCRMPGYHGTYFYGDYCSGWIHSFEYSGGTHTNDQTWPSLTVGSISTFGQDALGELYVADYGAGTIYRIVPQ
jgi:glucose/arabinose dehydrogenase